MTSSFKAAALFDAADQQLDAMARNSARWQYYAGRVAEQLGLHPDDFDREIDQAMAADGFQPTIPSPTSVLASAASTDQTDPELSSVAEEVDAIEWPLGEIAKALTEMQTQPSTSERSHIAKRARSYLDTVLLRAFRAKQISQGLRVHKAG